MFWPRGTLLLGRVTCLFPNIALFGSAVHTRTHSERELQGLAVELEPLEDTYVQPTNVKKKNVFFLGICVTNLITSFLYQNSEQTTLQHAEHAQNSFILFFSLILSFMLEFLLVVAVNNALSFENVVRISVPYQ